MGAAAAIVPALTLGYQIWSGERQRSEAKKASDKAAAAQEDLLAEAKAKEQEERNRLANIAKREAQAQAQRTRRVRALGTRGSILTGPMGLTEEPAVPGKTLLGY